MMSLRTQKSLRGKSRQTRWVAGHSGGQCCNLRIVLTLSVLIVVICCDSVSIRYHNTKTYIQAFAKFMKQWETDKVDGIVTLDEFIEYYRNVSPSIDRDEYFELMMRNAWHLPGGVGASANTTCRRVMVTQRDGTQSVQVCRCEAMEAFGRINVILGAVSHNFSPHRR